MMYSTGYIKIRRGPGDAAELGAGHKSLTVIRLRKSPGGDSRLAREEEINAYHGGLFKITFLSG